MGCALLNIKEEEGARMELNLTNVIELLHPSLKIESLLYIDQLSNKGSMTIWIQRLGRAQGSMEKVDRYSIGKNI